MPPEDIARLEEALSATGLPFKNETYDGPHGYTMADTSVYDEASTERHFTELEGAAAADPVLTLSGGTATSARATRGSPACAGAPTGRLSSTTMAISQPHHGI